MNTESTRAYLLSLPHVAETLQWGDNLVFWVGDKAAGGKMFALLSLTPGKHGVLSFAAGPERFAELVEREDLHPAPYFARIQWVALQRWSALPTGELQMLLHNAHALTLGKLPRRVRESLGSDVAARTQSAKRGRTARPG